MTLLTPGDVRKAAFSRPPLGRRGYNEDEVDKFLDRVEETITALSEQLEQAKAAPPVLFSAPAPAPSSTDTDSVLASLREQCAKLQTELEGVERERDMHIAESQRLADQVTALGKQVMDAIRERDELREKLNAAPAENSDTVQSARILALAHQLSEQVQTEAKSQAEALVSEAKTKAEEILSVANSKAAAVATESEKTAAAAQERIKQWEQMERSARERLRDFLQTQLSQITPL